MTETTSFVRPRGHYALRCRQTRFRSRGDHINDWTDDVIPCPDGPTAQLIADNWKRDKCDGFVYAYAGLHM